MKPVFKNVENEQTKTEDGRTVFLSRSMAVCVPITAETSDGKRYILISQRGEGTPNYEYHYNLVCGYLDHNESLPEAAKRELWEETGFNIDAYEENIVYGIQDEAWKTKSRPTGKMQNVTSRFGAYLKFDKKEDLPLLSTDFCEENEVIESIWLEESEALKIPDDSGSEDPKEEKVWAFNHYYVFRQWIEYIETKVPQVNPLPAIVSIWFFSHLILVAATLFGTFNLFVPDNLFFNVLSLFSYIAVTLEIISRIRKKRKVFKKLFSFSFST